MQGVKSKIQWFSTQIQIEPLNVQHLENRSLEYVIEGDYDNAISDCSKILLISPSRHFYVKRSQLFKDKRMFSQALKDLEEAKSLQKDIQDETAADIFLENSICMKNIKQVQQLAGLLQAQSQQQLTVKSNHILEQILSVKNPVFEKIQNQHKKEFQQLKKYYELQSLRLKEQLFCELNLLKAKLNYNYVNYQQKFIDLIDQTSLTSKDRAKMLLYFQNLSSEMQKYYIAAKNLRKIQDKSIKFEDFENMIMNKNKKDFMMKIYKFFDKYSSQISKAEELIKNIPYIGSVFNIIKSAMKTKGWVEDINIQNQCSNIERIAINTTSFNEFSTNVAYYTAQYFQTQILATHSRYKSQWETLVIRINEIKRQNLGVSMYKYKLTEEEQKVKDYATIHASIIMVAYACNKLKFNKETIKDVNRLYEQNKPQQANLKMGEILKTLSQVENILKGQQRNSNNLQKQQTEVVCPNEKSYCFLY